MRQNKDRAIMLEKPPIPKTEADYLTPATDAERRPGFPRRERKQRLRKAKKKCSRQVEENPESTIGNLSPSIPSPPSREACIVAGSLALFAQDGSWEALIHPADDAKVVTANREGYCA